MVTIHSSKINERQLVKRYLFVLFFINCFCISGLAAEISDAQQAILDTLPADQRESILIKMRQAESLQTDLEETFEEIITVIERPDKKVLTPEEEAEYLEESRNWIYGYEQFLTSPTTFAPASNMPIPPDFLLGPGDKLDIRYYGNENTTTQEFISCLLYTSPSPRDRG